jgi:hypothetical protein
MKGTATYSHAALERVLLEGLSEASVMIEGDRESPWESATFSGARHYFDMTVSGHGAIAAAANLGKMINENRIAIAGHVVADIMLSAHQMVQPSNVPLVVLGIEALTVSE